MLHTVMRKYRNVAHAQLHHIRHNHFGGFVCQHSIHTKTKKTSKLFSYPRQFGKVAFTINNTKPPTLQYLDLHEIYRNNNVRNARFASTECSCAQFPDCTDPVLVFPPKYVDHYLHHGARCMFSLLSVCSMKFCTLHTAGDCT